MNLLYYAYYTWGNGWKIVKMYEFCYTGSGQHIVMRDERRKNSFQQELAFDYFMNMRAEQKKYQMC